MNEWLIFSLVLLGIWSIMYILLPIYRKRMLLVGGLTAPFGLTEPLFVPEYWSQHPIRSSLRSHHSIFLSEK